MIFSRSLNQLQPSNPVVCTGSFDGVHLGHASVINRLVERAREMGTKSLVLTFWPHPRLVMGGDASEVKLLTSLEEKAQLMDALGVDVFLALDFNLQLVNLSAPEFVERILVGDLGAKHLVLGHNHRFGHRGEGNLDLLESLKETLGFSVEQAEPFILNGFEVSSTLIRGALGHGSMAQANALLGRRYRMEGTIRGGMRLGRTIGFPTANIVPLHPFKLVPANGVYAVWAHLGNSRFPSMLNIGVRPTVSSERLVTIEAHLIGFSGDAYDQPILIEFVDRVRDEQKFPSIDHLRAQLASDREEVLGILRRCDEVG